jgi:choline-glycine betaine transporter
VASSVHPLAPHALPVFIPSPDGPDYLMIGMAAFLLAATFGVGLLYWRLHALPEHIAHKSKKVQFQIVCVLALLAM